jgi:hypothetical protein
MNSTITDHASILVHLSLDCRLTKPLDRYTVEKVNYSEAIKCIEPADFTFITPARDGESTANQFVEILSSAITTNTKKLQVPRRKKNY